MLMNLLRTNGKWQKKNKRYWPSLNSIYHLWKHFQKQLIICFALSWSKLIPFFLHFGCWSSWISWSNWNENWYPMSSRFFSCLPPPHPFVDICHHFPTPNQWQDVNMWTSSTNWDHHHREKVLLCRLVESTARVVDGSAKQDRWGQSHHWHWYHHRHRHHLVQTIVYLVIIALILRIPKGSAPAS